MKNKKNRVFSRVLSRLAWATFYHVCEEKDNEYKEVLAAKRLIEDFGGEDVKPVFYNREWQIEFTIYQSDYEYNCLYTVDASHGYVNDYAYTNKSHVDHLIDESEFSRDCTLRQGYSDYQMFQQYAENVVFWALTREEYADYLSNGNIANIPYDVSIRLWRQLTECTRNVVNEAIAYRRDVL